MQEEKEKNGLYMPIPQWRQKESQVIGIKDLYLVKTCGNDYFLKENENQVEVLNATMTERKMCAESMEEALRFIREECEAFLTKSYRVTFELKDCSESFNFRSNASLEVMEDACKMFPYRRELFSLVTKEQLSSVFQKMVKEVYGFMIQEEKSLDSAAELKVACEYCCHE